MKINHLCFCIVLQSIAFHYVIGVSNHNTVFKKQHIIFRIIITKNTGEDIVTVKDFGTCGVVGTAVVAVVIQPFSV